MLPNELPEIIDPLKLCALNNGLETILQGSMSVGKLRNKDLETLCFADQPITLDLKFYRDLQNIPVITGQFSAMLQLSCQRCLQDLDYSLEQSIAVGVVTSLEEAKKLPTDLEPMWVQDASIRLSDWVAEEIYLAIPIVPKHDNTCGMQQYFADEPKQTETKSQKTFPFKDLKQYLE